MTFTIRGTALCVAAMLLGGCASLTQRSPCDPGNAASPSASRTPCSYDPESRTYKECFHVTADGKCAHFGGPCQPSGTAAAPPCLYDPATKSNRVCHHVTAYGGCVHFGDACTP